MPLPSQSLRKQGSSGFRALLQLDEQQSDASPNQLTHTNDQRHEDAGTGREAQAGSGHKETTLAAAQLQRDEEKQIGKERGESQNEDTIDAICRSMVLSCSRCRSTNGVAHRLIMGRWLRKFITRLAKPFWYPTIKNQTPRMQKQMMASISTV